MLLRAAVFFTLILTLLFMPFSLAADEKKHPVDTWLERAMEKDGSTHGMRRATVKATGMWDKELNRVYRKLLAASTAQQKSALVKSQRAWLKYRDAELVSIRELIGKKDGTMWPLMADGAALELVKERTLQLQGYLEIGKEPSGQVKSQRLNVKSQRPLTTAASL